MSYLQRGNSKKPRSEFGSFHPTLNFLYFVTVITCSVRFQHPIFLGISFFSSFLQSVLFGKKSSAFYLFCFLIFPIYTSWYALYHHFGITNIGTTWIGNHFTLEAFVYGAVRALVVIIVLFWFSYLYAVFSSDKLIYLFGKAAPKFSLYLAIIFRTASRVQEKFYKINEAQSGIGRGIKQGNILMRIKNFFRIISILITWMLDSFGEASDSMKSRGYSLKGRTAFSIYYFGNRDRLFTIFSFFLLTIVWMGDVLGQTEVLYNPEIVWGPVSSVSYLFYIAYTILCIQPLIIEVYVKIHIKQ